MQKKPSTRSRKNDLDVLLPLLLAAYARALIFVQGFPAPFSRKEVVTFQYKDGLLRNLTPRKRKTILVNRKIKRRVVFRPIVNVLVEAHVQAKLSELLRRLRLVKFETMQGENSKKNEKYVGQIEQVADVLAGWKHVAFLFSSSYTSPIIGFLAPVVLSVIGINIFSPSDFSRSFIEVFQVQGWEFLIKLILVTGAVGVLLYVVFAPVVVSAFRVKRAIFAGGLAEYNLYDFPIFNRRDIMLWIDFPKANIYHLEYQVFKNLEIWKKPEFPIDFIFDASAYYAFGFTIFISFYILSSWILRNEISVTSMVLFFTFWIATVYVIISGIRNYQLRQLDENS